MAGVREGEVAVRGLGEVGGVGMVVLLCRGGRLHVWWPCADAGEGQALGVKVAALMAAQAQAWGVSSWEVRPAGRADELMMAEAAVCSAEPRPLTVTSPGHKQPTVQYNGTRTSPVAYRPR